jgi:hypothetical protein
MTYDPDTTPQERAQLLKAVRLLIKTHRAIAELREGMQRDARALRKHNRIMILRWQMEAAARRGWVCVSDDDIPK